MTTTVTWMARILIPGSAAKRVALWEMDFSALGINTTTDCQNTYIGSFCSATAAGTPASTFTPVPTGSSGGTATDVAVTTGPLNYPNGTPPTTVTVPGFFLRSPNQRGTAFWQASPGGEFFFPNTVSTGPVFGGLSTANTGAGLAVVKYSEI